MPVRGLRARLLAPALAVTALAAVLPALAHGATPVDVADCGSASAAAVTDSAQIVVEIHGAAAFTVGGINATAWRHPATSDPTWQLDFYGFRYLPPLAERAAEDGQSQALARMVAELVAFHHQDPDLGKSTFGWDEGAAQRRLEAENCLFALTRASSLVPGMRADAAVQLGPRYYGPPNFAAHNHGLMANLRIIRAGALLHVPSWRTTGLTRIEHEAPMVWDSAGLTKEQSSQYQETNIGLWQLAQDVLTSYGETAAAHVVAVEIAKAQRVLSWLTEPDGRIVQFGDAGLTAGRTVAQSGTAFRDDQGGLAVGRWSWTSATTSYFTLRYGPARMAHGHDDAGSLTWSSLGQRVLVGVGHYDYDYASSSLARWQRSRLAANVAMPVNGATTLTGPVKVLSARVRSAAQSYVLSDSMDGRGHTRTVTVADGTHTASVVDRFGGAGPVQQVWHLDPAWHWVSGGRGSSQMVFRTDTGRTLVVSTGGALVSRMLGSSSPVGGWTFPAEYKKTANNELILRSSSSAIGTTFTLF